MQDLRETRQLPVTNKQTYETGVGKALIWTGNIHPPEKIVRTFVDCPILTVSPLLRRLLYVGLRGRMDASYQLLQL